MSTEYFALYSHAAAMACANVFVSSHFIFVILSETAYLRLWRRRTIPDNHPRTKPTPGVVGCNLLMLAAANPQAIT